MNNKQSAAGTALLYRKRPEAAADPAGRGLHSEDDWYKLSVNKVSTMMKTRYYTISQAAAAIGMPKHKLDWLLRNKRISYVQRGSRGYRLLTLPKLKRELAEIEARKAAKRLKL